MAFIIFILLSIVTIMPFQLYPNFLSNKRTVIIIDIPGVLFKENVTSLSKKIGVGTLASYAIMHWKNPANICFNVLENMSEQEEIEKSALNFPMQFKGKSMPCCVREWHQGYKTAGQVRNEIDNYIENIACQNYFSSSQEKNLVKRIINIIFDENQLADITKPVFQMVNLANQLKQSGYQLFFFSNVPSELFNIIKTKYPDIMALFEGGLVSCQTHVCKPDKKMFKKLLDTYKLEPKQCILIDEKEETIIASQEFGICGVTYKKAPILIKKLKKLGIMLSN